MELRQIYEILLKKRWFVIYTFAAIFCSIMTASFLIPRSYDTTAKVLLRNPTTSAPLSTALGFKVSSGDTNETIRADFLAHAFSWTVAEEVIKQMDLKRERVRSRIMRAFPPIKPILAAVGVDILSTHKPITPDDFIQPPLSGILFPIPKVSIAQYEDTNLLEIEARSTDPKLAMDLANTWAEVFIRLERQRMVNDRREARQSIYDGLKEAHQNVKTAFSRLKEFKNVEKSYNLSAETQTLITRRSQVEQDMEEVSVNYNKAMYNMAIFKQKMADLPEFQKTAESIKENERIAGLKSKLQEYYLELATSKKRYAADHPEMRDLNLRINESKALMKEELERVWGGANLALDPVREELRRNLVENSLIVATHEPQMALLKSLHQKYLDLLASVPDKETTLSELQSALTINTNLYEGLLTVDQQLSLVETVTLSVATLAERAPLPDITDSRHRHPSTLVSFILAMFLGLFFSIWGGLALHYLSDAVTTPAEVRGLEGVYLLGSVGPMGKKSLKTAQYWHPKSKRLREAIRSIRNNIRFATRRTPPGSLVVFSVGAQEGKSYVATSLAASFADQGQKVLLMDGNLDAPVGHKLFRVSVSPGLTDLLSGDGDLAAVLKDTPVENLTFLAAGTSLPNPNRLVDSPRMPEVLAQLEGMFDLVVIDAPPQRDSSFPLRYGEMTGNALLVIESGKTRRPHVEQLVDMVKMADFRLIGGVLNKLADIHRT
ncbi:MAG: polysaccharide biosynthesis tyrosine autokinase [Magnetococcales bacterium]|nr:polysaccharide biosynthesis tyrosine autokinase [Magnetococcales bacterium]